MAVTPLELFRADWTDGSHTQERMSPRQAKSRVANSERKRSDDRHDIGYTRSGVAVIPCREELDMASLCRSKQQSHYDASQPRLTPKRTMELLRRTTGPDGIRRAFAMRGAPNG